MIDDVLFDMLDDYNFDMFYDYSFERIFRNHFHFPQKRIVLTVLLRLLSFRVWVSTIYRKIFYDSRFEMIYDFHFEMSKGVLFTFWNALWLSFWNEGDKIFVHSFLRKAWSLSLRWNIFLKKGDGLLCQILMILQC